MSVCANATTAAPCTLQAARCKAKFDQGGAAGGRLTWNLMGMMNNPHYRVKVHAATTPDGLLAMRFEHPCLAGGEAGGCAHIPVLERSLCSCLAVYKEVV